MRSDDVLQLTRSPALTDDWSKDFQSNQLDDTGRQKPGRPRAMYMYIYIKAINNLDVKLQEFQISFHQYLQWVPTQQEYEIMSNPERTKEDVDSIFRPTVFPSNAKDIDDGVEEERENLPALHMLRPGDRDIWGETVRLTGNQVLLGISRKYKATISSPLNLRSYPFDFQSLHIFFECLQSTRSIVLMPSPLRKSCVDVELGAWASDVNFALHPPVIEFAAYGKDPSTYVF